MARNIKKFNNKYVSNAGVEVLPYMTNETAQGRQIIKFTRQYLPKTTSLVFCTTSIQLQRFNSIDYSTKKGLALPDDLSAFQPPPSTCEPTYV